MALIKCPECGNNVSDKTDKCIHCGFKLNNLQKNRTKNKTVSLLLCIFLGCFGAHKFYERKIGMGILYLFTMGLFTIGWIADIVIIALKPEYYD